MNRRALILSAAEAAAEAREAIDIDEFVSLDVYAAATALGVRVRFVNESMEGLYSKGPPPRILVSPARPVARCAFTCAHELGHHWFGHGNSLHELQDETRGPSEDPKEIVAEAFGSFLLMPTVAVRSAFARRSWRPVDLTPLQALTIASEFGVGYTTLITHLAMTMFDISFSQRAALIKTSAAKIRKTALGRDEKRSVFLDRHSSAASYELKVGDALVVPRGAKMIGSAATLEYAHLDYDVFRALTQGISEVQFGRHTAQIRVVPPEFVGLAEYRFMESADDDED